MTQTRLLEQVIIRRAILETADKSLADPLGTGSAFDEAGHVRRDALRHGALGKGLPQVRID